MRLTDNQRRWLDTIAYAEGTWADGGEQGYRTMFGGGLFNGYERHPDRVIRSSGYASAAAGRYQFMPDTWAEAAGKLGLKDFSPASQDQAALYLIRKRGVDPDSPITEQSLERLAPEWASLPTRAGKSYYNQPVRRHRELFDFFGGKAGTGPTGAGPMANGQQPQPQHQAPQPQAPDALAPSFANNPLAAGLLQYIHGGGSHSTRPQGGGPMGLALSPADQPSLSQQITDLFANDNPTRPPQAQGAKAQGAKPQGLINLMPGNTIKGLTRRMAGQLQFA